MKYILILFSVTLFTKGCNDNKPDKNAVKTAQDEISIDYEASSRGFYQKVNIKKEQFSLTNARGGEALTKQISNSDWSELVDILDKIDAEKLEKNYVNPDDLRRDAAIPAKLTISYKENVVTNVEFGHGNPPEELAALLTKIEAMVNAVDKP
ncbi:hypothetical protein C8N46_101654 [Kordia periserrulae]|uniref:Uncharacterized protein n=1 Tax=Kordia periserrulae TaxID=701523 RepID=A0A2T6C6T4_9FLAO|nr:hypothetical protein [Kordia periserrulae]PTX64044.1 hypothetical protein C8N46_101654 [Kordia periserrulae]